MKKLLLIATAVFLLAPVGLMADGIDFASTGGTLTASGTPTTLSTTTPSTLTSVVSSSMSVGSSTANIGTLSFTTGAMTSGSLSSNAMFGSGGSITVATNSSFTGDPNDSSAFTGSFSSLSWAPITGLSGAYSLDGTAMGSFSSAFATLFGLPSGSGGSGVFISGEVFQSGNTYSLTSVDLNVPEASTMSLLGFGLLALFAAAYWRRRQEVLVA